VYNSYYFLRCVASELHGRLKGHTLVSCFSQSRDELLIEFHKDGKHFFMRASLVPELTAVTFPKQIRRARKNSVDLFPPLVMLTVNSVHVFENDRSFCINLTEGHGILFKMHGNRANVIHLKDNAVADLFRKSITADLNLSPASLNMPINWEAAKQDPRKALVTFTPEVWHYLDENGFGNADAHQQWQMILETRAKLESADTYYHIEHRHNLLFSLLPFAKQVEKYKDPLEAVTTYAAVFLSRSAFDREKGRQLNRVQTLIRKGETYLQKTRSHFEASRSDQHFQVWADILMANLERIAPGVKSVTLPNFYDEDSLVAIKLNPQLTPQKNAEAYYRKAKNRSIELKRNQELLIAKEIELLNLNQLLQRIEAAATLEEVEQISDTAPAAKEPSEIKLPYRESVYMGFRIWIGKDAVTNDELTTRFGSKEDLWLHAKDVAGSHVLIKHQAGKKFPKDVIERAAQLAAFYSKRKTDTLCPVAYTPRKYVRKRKGDPAGAVVVERESVILVEPKGI
jgi:predicted ribosome quality control (RQC) complex YloA/Tae2 family protein